MRESSRFSYIIPRFPTARSKTCKILLHPPYAGPEKGHPCTFFNHKPYLDVSSRMRKSAINIFTRNKKINHYQPVMFRKGCCKPEGLMCLQLQSTKLVTKHQTRQGGIMNIQTGEQGRQITAEDFQSPAGDVNTKSTEPTIYQHTDYQRIGTAGIHMGASPGTGNRPGHCRSECTD